MATRRSLLGGVVGLASGLLLDATGWAPRRASANSMSSDHQLFGGFALLKPGENRAPATYSGPRFALIPETTGEGRPPTVHSVNLLELSEVDRGKGPLGAVVADDGKLRLRSGSRLVHSETGYIVSETLVYEQVAVGEPCALTAIQHVPIPYSVQPPGSPEYGYGAWITLPDVNPQMIALASGFAATALWLDAETLFRIEVFRSAPVSSHNAEAVIRAARTAIRTG